MAAAGNEMKQQYGPIRIIGKEAGQLTCYFKKKKEKKNLSANNYARGSVINDTFSN